MSERTLSIVVPVYNEEARILPLLEALETSGDRCAAAAGLRLEEVIVVDDGSTDATPRLLLRPAQLAGRLRVLPLARNRGKGAAVRAGMQAARGELALLTDADLSTPLSDLPRLSAAVDAGADVAMGSRALPESVLLARQPRYRELMGKAFNVAFRSFTGLSFRDTQCGFKLYRLDTARVLFERQRTEGFAFDAELCVIAERLGLTTVELPVTWRNNADTRVALVRASAQMALDLVRIGWLARRASVARGRVLADR